MVKRVGRRAGSGYVDHHESDTSESRLLSTETLGIGESGFAATGEFFPLQAAHIIGNLTTTSTIYTPAGTWNHRLLVDPQNVPDNAQLAVGGVFIGSSGSDSESASFRIGRNNGSAVDGTEITFTDQTQIPRIIPATEVTLESAWNGVDAFRFEYKHSTSSNSATIRSGKIVLGVQL